MKELSEQQLLEAIEQDGKALTVFLYTPFCGTCKAARRMLEIAEHMLAGEAEFAAANVNMLPVLVNRYRITSVPALLTLPAVRSSGMKIYYRMVSVEQMLHYIRSVTS
ncbi:thioredoxin family protein ['Paenibacillus yunnanensis' Narsing Rao et al. 2020]|uniref:thioredoxin family protein n=1 Tax=Paenibacillus tengchongensis TaxID=2608684 RepID=UPI00124C29F0|nr:thioredoxin family protein [Paenibacillus tengchongensis]